MLTACSSQSDGAATLNSSVSEAASKEVEIEIPIASPTGLSEGGNIHDNVGGYSSKSLGQYAQDKWPPEQELPVHSFVMEYLTEQQGPSAVLGDRLILATANGLHRCLGGISSAKPRRWWLQGIILDGIIKWLSSQRLSKMH